MAFWRFAGADAAELRVIELAGLNELPRLFNRRLDAAHVGHGRGIVEAIEHLRYALLGGPTDLARAEVARGQGRLERHVEDG